MQKVICVETLFTEVPFEERLRLVKEYGFECIEFWTWEDKDIERMKKLCIENGLRVTAFSGDRAFSMIDASEGEQYIAFTRESMAVAKTLGCHTLVLHSNALGENGVALKRCEDLSAEKKRENMVTVLKALAPWAEKEGVVLVLEALNTRVDHPGYFLCHTEDAVEVVEAVGSSHVKILYDVYHMQIMEGNLISTMTRYRDLIGHIHVADVPGRHEPGTGEINFSNIMRVLERSNYQGAVGFELFPLRSSAEAVKAIRAL
ncbi:MAG: hydroxypyruvate isomerase family protein [Candidatus Caldatribacteriaceae bacterium]